MEWVLLILFIAWFFFFNATMGKLADGLMASNDEMNKRFDAIESDLENIRRVMIGAGR